MIEWDWLFLFRIKKCNEWLKHEVLYCVTCQNPV